MIEITKQKVFISKFIEFERCRWKANIIKSPVVNLLKSWIVRFDEVDLKNQTYFF